MADHIKEDKYFRNVEYDMDNKTAEQVWHVIDLLRMKYNNPKMISVNGLIAKTKK